MIGRARFGVAVAALSLAAIGLLWRYGAAALAGAPPPLARRPVIERGSLYDRNGSPLAVNVDKYNVACWKPEMPIEAFERTAAELAAVMGCPEAELVDRYRGATSDFFYLKKALPASVGVAVKEWVSTSGTRGIVVETLPGRLYPERSLASHAVGFVDTDARGVAGIERAWDSALLPYDVTGLDPDEATGAYTGSSVRLTIDAAVQLRFEQLARASLEREKAEAVMLFAIDVSSGEILSYVSLPDFDPNDPRAVGASLYNRPATYAYEPGSVFKVFTMATLLEAGAIDRTSVFVCDGTYERETGGKEPIEIKCMGVHGKVDVSGILSYSCNAGAAYASDRMAPLEFYSGLRALGFGAPTRIGFPDESAGLLAQPSSWSLRSRPTIAFGQEILVTALQVLQAACAVGNGGTLVRPSLVARVTGPDGTVEYESSAAEKRRVLSPETCRLVVDSMELSSRPGGTGARAGLPDVKMAVKTGTAQMIDPDTRAYSSEDFVASCIGLFPAERPRYAVYAVVVKPRGESVQGGRVAAPLVRDAADALLLLLGSARPSVPEVVHPGAITLAPPAGVSIGATMPDLRGAPKRALLPLLWRSDVRVTITGDGWVVRQSPAPGTPVTEGMAILLELE